MPTHIQSVTLFLTKTSDERKINYINYRLFDSLDVCEL